MSLVRTRDSLLRHFSRLAAGVLLFGLAGIASAQESQPLVLTTLNRSITPFVDETGKPLPAFRYQWPDEKAWVERNPARIPLPAEKEPAVGYRVWEHSADMSLSGGLKSKFETFCSELPIGVNLGVRYQYQILPPETPEAYGLPDDEKGREEAGMRTICIRELFGRNYKKLVKDDDAARAVQIAIWEVVHESKPRRGMRGEPRFDLRDGTFKADYPDWEKAPKYVREAQVCLDDLSFNTKILQHNCRGKELIWMKGLPSPQAANGVPQSQFALKELELRESGAGSEEGGGLSGLVNTGTSSNDNSPGSSGSNRGNQSGSVPPFQPGGTGAPPFQPATTGAPPFQPGVPGVGNQGPTPFTERIPIDNQRLIPGNHPQTPNKPRDPDDGGGRKSRTTIDELSDPKEVPGPAGIVLAGFAVAILAGRSLVKRHLAPSK